MRRPRSARPAFVVVLAVAVAVAAAVGCGGGHAAADAGPADAGPADAFVATLDPGVTPRPAGAIRLATFNVRRFFDTTCNSGQCGGSNYEELPTPADFDARAQTLATAILGLDATAVALQEIETQVSLDALTAHLMSEYPSAVLGTITSAGSVNTAVIARLPILDVRHHANLPLTEDGGVVTWFSRDFLEVHLDAGGGGRVILFAAHFRSQANDDPARRLVEAQTAATLVVASAAEFPAALVVLGGDLNDQPGSPPIDALEASGDLVRVERDLSPDAQVTVYDTYGALALDHLLIDVHAGGAFVPGTALVVRSAPGVGLAGSDHAALIADFTLP
jgi:endonuclease/exonuclease/phosphatase family metal-dependent hydrolase